MTEPRSDETRHLKRSWLPRDRADRVPPDAPVWVPPGFARERIKWEALSYIVVDELSSDVAGLVVSEWPRLDHKGRLRFPGASWRVGARLGELDAVLAKRRLHNAIADVPRVRARAVRIGDAFAARVNRPRGRMAAVPGISRWLKPPVYDVSADARDAAKAALYAAVAPTMSPAHVHEIAAEAMDLAE